MTSMLFSIVLELLGLSPPLGNDSLSSLNSLGVGSTMKDHLTNIRDMLSSPSMGSSFRVQNQRSNNRIADQFGQFRNSDFRRALSPRADRGGYRGTCSSNANANTVLDSFYTTRIKTYGSSNKSSFFDREANQRQGQYGGLWNSNLNARSSNDRYSFRVASDSYRPSSGLESKSYYSRTGSYNDRGLGFYSTSPIGFGISRKKDAFEGNFSNEERDIDQRDLLEKYKQPDIVDQFKSEFNPENRSSLLVRNMSPKKKRKK